LKCLRAFFKYAHHEEYISYDPAVKVSWQREGKVLINVFTDEEVESLLCAFDFSSYLSARNKLILAIAFDTGASIAYIWFARVFLMIIKNRCVFS